eukprot:11079654-Prorocentrum_lima.AAC.1
MGRRTDRDTLKGSMGTHAAASLPSPYATLHLLLCDMDPRRAFAPIARLAGCSAVACWYHDFVYEAPIEKWGRGTDNRGKPDRQHC